MVYLEEFAADALLSVQQAAARTGSPVELLSLRALAHSLFGRRPVDPGGPSEFDILEPLMKCNTMSYDDSVKIEAHLAGHSGAERVVDIALGDGQSVILFEEYEEEVAAAVRSLGDCRWRLPRACS